MTVRVRCDGCGADVDWDIAHPILGGFGDHLPKVYCSACCPTCARRKGVKGGVRG